MVTCKDLEVQLDGVSKRLESVEAASSNNQVLQIVEDISKRLKVMENYDKSKEDAMSTTLKQFQEKIDSNASQKNEILVKIEESSQVISTKVDKTAEDIKIDILNIREVIIKKQNVELMKQRDELSKLRANVKTLQTRLLLGERSHNQSNQHSRKVNFEIAGIPETVSNKELKSKIVEIIKKAGVTNVSASDLEVAHRLPSRKTPAPVIIKAKRDFIDTVFEQKKNFQNIVVKDLGFSEESKLYLNNNLSPIFKSLRYNAFRLKDDGFLQDAWYYNGYIKVKSFDGKIRTIAHEMDLFDIASEYDNFTFNTEFYKSLITGSGNFDDVDMDNYDNAGGNHHR